MRVVNVDHADETARLRESFTVLKGRLGKELSKEKKWLNDRQRKNEQDLNRALREGQPYHMRAHTHAAWVDRCSGYAVPTHVLAHGFVLVCHAVLLMRMCLPCPCSAPAYSKTLVSEYQDQKYADLKEPSKALTLRRLGQQRHTGTATGTATGGGSGAGSNGREQLAGTVG